MQYLWRSLIHNWLAGIIFVLSLLYLIETLMLPRDVFESLLLVGPVVLIIVCLYVVLIVSCMKKMRTERAHSLSTEPKPGQSGTEPKEFRKIQFMLLLAVYLILIYVVGFELASLLYVPSALYFLGVRKIMFILLYTLVYMAFIVGIFYYVFQVRLPMLFL